LQYSPHTLVNWKSGEFGGHSTGGMNSGVSLLAKTAFFNDVTITSSLRSVVQVWHILQFFKSHRLSGWFVSKIMKSCLNLSKLRQKYRGTVGPFFQDTVYMCSFM